MRHRMLNAVSRMVNETTMKLDETVTKPCAIIRAQ
jgi:hypothetical protein